MEKGKAINEAQNFQKSSNYLRVFKGMLEQAETLGLSLLAVLLYCLAFNRAQLSAENNWIDKDGKLYIILTRSEFARVAGCSKKTAQNAFAVLIKAGLFEEVAQKNKAGCTTAPRIFVRQWADDTFGRGYTPLTKDTIHVIPGPYIEFPRALLDSSAYQGLSLRAKFLYAYAVDRTRLSVDFGRRDRRGYWCEIPEQEAQSVLGCKHGTLSTTWVMLVNAGLVTRAKVECGCACRVYVHPLEGAVHTDSQNSVENELLPNGTSTTHHSSNLSSCNSTNFAPPLSNDSPQGNPSQNPYKKVFSEEGSIHACAHAHDAPENRQSFSAVLDRELLRRGTLAVLPQDSPGTATVVAAIIDHTLGLMAKDKQSDRRIFYIGDERVEKEELLSHYSLITCSILITMISKVVPRWNGIQKPEGYLRSALFNAYDNHLGEAEYTSAILEAKGIASQTLC